MIGDHQRTQREVAGALYRGGRTSHEGFAAAVDDSLDGDAGRAEVQAVARGVRDNGLAEYRDVEVGGSRERRWVATPVRAAATLVVRHGPLDDGELTDLLDDRFGPVGDPAPEAEDVAAGLDAHFRIRPPVLRGEDGDRVWRSGPGGHDGETGDRTEEGRTTDRTGR